MAAKFTHHDEITEIARSHFGFDALRPGQEEAICAILDGHDTLVVQPTGSGKSAIYQIAGMLIDGATAIISPLIALQKDQVRSLERLNVPAAAAVNSSLPVAQRRDDLERAGAGAIEYLFLSPEQLHKPETIQTLVDAKVSLFVVDEAHCISDWGHSFRPDYMRLGSVIDKLGGPRILALTATATPRVRDEIVGRLRMRNPKIFVQGFDRPNIYLRVDHFKTETEKRDALTHRVRWADKPGIVYTATRKAAEQIMESLAVEGVDAVFYHGGLSGPARNAVQERFMAGEADVMVATNAFGMGVDKSDVRFVFHYDPCDSLDSYYQEFGRGGRDGKPADAALFYRRQDIGAQSFKTSEGSLETDLLGRVVDEIAKQDEPVDPGSVAKELGISERKLTTAVQRLEDVGAFELLPSGEVKVLQSIEPSEAIDLAAQEQELHREGKRERLTYMREYAETSTCRRSLLLQYFGDPLEGPCGYCDNCEASGLSRESRAGTRREV